MKKIPRPPCCSPTPGGIGETPPFSQHAPGTLERLAPDRVQHHVDTPSLLVKKFLSAVAGRLGLWGKYGSGWVKFVAYTGSVNWYLPAGMVPPVAITATILETAFGLALLAGFQIRNAALGSAGLLTLFALAMLSGNPKSPFDYSVFTAAFGDVHASGLHCSNPEFRVRSPVIGG